MNENTPINTDENGRDDKGRFIKGNSGKPKGAQNTTTKEVKELISDFLTDKINDLHKIWDCLSDQEKATLFVHLAKIVVPRPTTQKENSYKEPRVFNIPDIGNRQTPIHLIDDNQYNKPLTASEVAEISKMLENDY